MAEIYKDSTIPISPPTEGVVGIGEASSVRATTQIYLPARFDDLKCDVLSTEFTLLNMRQGKFAIEFVVSGDLELEQLYKDEEWKYDTLKNFYKYKKFEGPLPKNPVPIALLLLNSTLRVTEATLEIESRREPPVDFDQAIDLVSLPHSYPPAKEIPSNKNFVYYEKKTTAFYGELILGKKYRLEVELETVGVSFEMAPLLPYGTVTYHHLTDTNESDFGTELNFNFVTPKSDDVIPEELSYNLYRHLDDPRMPTGIKPAIPFRGEIPLFKCDGSYGMPIIKRPQDLSDDFLKESSDIEGKTFTNYETFRTVRSVAIPPDKNEDIIINVNKNPIPSRIYSQIKKVPGVEVTMVEYIICNLCDKKRRLRITTELVGLDAKESKTIFLPKLNNGQGKKAGQILRHAPLINHDNLSKIINGQTASVMCTVYDEDEKSTLLEETFDVHFLPHDQIVWSMRDIKNSQTFDYAEFIAAWVYPNDHQGILDRVRVGAIDYHPSRQLGSALNGTLDGIKNEVKAVYEHLQKDYKLKYLNQPFTTTMVNHSQRVVPPERVIQNKAGNCIDLTVLFASLLEGIGLNSYILLTPNHAFIGWGNKYKTSEMVFLETTAIEETTFEDASAFAEKTFREEFLFAGSDNPMFGDLLGFMKGCHIVDLGEARAKGVKSEIL